MRRFRRLGVLIAAIVCAAGVAWSTTSAHSNSQSTLAAKQPFAVVLPAIVRLEAGQVFRDPGQEVIDETETPVLTATSTSAPTNTPTITSSATPTNAPECDLDVKRNLNVHVLAPNTAEVTNSSTQCTYPVGVASYTMFDNNLSHQQLFSSQTALLGPGQVQTFVVALPECAYQLDVFYGALIERFDPQHGQIYGDRILVTRVVRDAGFCLPGTPMPTTTATTSATPAGSPTPTATALPTNTPTATGTPAGDTPTPTAGGN